MSEVGFERRFGHAERPPAIREGQPALDHREPRSRLTQPMLQELRGFDRRDHRRPGAPVRQRLPDGERLVVSPKASKHVRSIDGDPLARPRGIDWRDGWTGAEASRAARPSSEIGDAPRRPPRLIPWALMP